MVPQAPREHPGHGGEVIAPKLLVVGAREGSLGERIVSHAWSLGFRSVVTAGVAGEQNFCEITNKSSIIEVLRETSPDYVVCTVGINEPAGIASHPLREHMANSFHINVIGPMELLRQFLEAPQSAGFQKRFVAISSNSARIARTQSIPYCASKAALSMALRAAARETARWEQYRRPLIWGYEPGLLADTPMTVETADQFPGMPLHRMPGVGPEGLNPDTLAARVVRDLVYGGAGQHGAMFSFDAGEQ